MFNPKEALQRIRKTKVQKQDIDNVLNESEYNRSLFPQNQYGQKDNKNKITSSITKPLYSRDQPRQNNNTETFEERIQKLQFLVSQLGGKLTQSNQTVEQLKKQNNQLQTHVLKLQHQNTQLKNSQKPIELRHSLSSRLNHSVSSVSQNSKLIAGFNEKTYIKKAQSKVIQDEVFSPEVQDALQQIKTESIINILKRKQQNFRALKNASKQSLQKGQKALRQLANLHKNYGKHYKKPTLIINFEDTDFQ